MPEAAILEKLVIKQRCETRRQNYMTQKIGDKMLLCHRCLEPIFHFQQIESPFETRFCARKSP